MVSNLTNNAAAYFTRHKAGIKLLIFIIIVGVMTFRGLIQIPQIRESKAEIARLTNQIEYEKSRQEEVEALKDKVGSDEYIEKIAGEKLGLIKSNAKIFVDVSGEQ